jgi:hypothetical protein
MSTDKATKQLKLDERNYVEKPLLDQLDGLGWDIIDLTDKNQVHPGEAYGDLKKSVDMTMLSGVIRTTSDRRIEHVHKLIVPWIWRSRLPLCEDQVCTRRCGLRARTSWEDLSVLGLRLGECVAARAGYASISHTADRRKASGSGGGNPPVGVPGVWSYSASGDRLRPAKAHIH